MHPRLHLLSSYLLILPSVSIRVDCCHFRPVCPCISFSFSPSLSSTWFPPSFSIHLSPGKQTGATALTPAGVGAAVLSGGSTPLKHFARQLLVKGATDSIVEHQEDYESPHTWFIVHTGQKQPHPVTTFLSKRHIVFFHVSMCERKSFPLETCILVCVPLCHIKLKIVYCGCMYPWFWYCNLIDAISVWQ